MTIESLISERPEVVETLWTQNRYGEHPAGEAVTSLRKRLRAIRHALDGETLAFRDLIAEQVKERMQTHDGSLQLIYDYFAIERCLFQAWSMSSTGWPPETEAQRLRTALTSVVSEVIDQISEERLVREHLVERDALDGLERAAHASLGDTPGGGIRSCLGAARAAFGPSASAALVFFDKSGALTDRVTVGDIAKGLPAIESAGWQVSLHSDLVEIPVGELALLARSLPLSSERRGALFVGLRAPTTGPVRRLLETVAERFAHVLENLERQQLTSDELDRMTDESSLRERFVATLAHDLRGPLNAARLCLDCILTSTSPPDVERNVHRAVQALKRADEMMRDLLDASRVRAGQPLPLNLAPCDLGDLCRDVLEELSPLYGPRFRLQIESGPQGIWCERELRRAIWNLVMNALRHGTRDRPITLAVAVDGSWVRISVQNEGPPISPDAVARIFDPYLKSEGGGWGLGLTLVRACAEAHGGTVTVSSGENAPTTFTIRLPFDSRPAYEELLRSADARSVHSPSAV